MKPLRPRELLLSLKYCTIEACFSVPMLNLTLTQFPFVLGFAVAGLGWSAGAIGWLAAIHHLCNAIQPPVYWVLRRRFSLHRIMVLGFWFNSLPWLSLLASWAYSSSFRWKDRVAPGTSRASAISPAMRPCGPAWTSRR